MRKGTQSYHIQEHFFPLTLIRGWCSHRVLNGLMGQLNQNVVTENQYFAGRPALAAGRTSRRRERLLDVHVLQLKTSLKILYLQAALGILPTGESTGFVDWAGDAVSASEEALSTSASQREFVITVPGLDFKQALFTLPRSKSSSPKPGLNKLIQ